MRAAATPPVLAGGIGVVAAYGLVLAALGMAPAAGVAALRETSIVMATILAAVVLHERVERSRWLGSVVVVAGIALVVTSVGRVTIRFQERESMEVGVAGCGVVGLGGARRLARTCCSPGSSASCWRSSRRSWHFGCCSRSCASRSRWTATCRSLVTLSDWLMAPFKLFLQPFSLNELSKLPGGSELGYKEYLDKLDTTVLVAMIGWAIVGSLVLFVLRDGRPR